MTEILYGEQLEELRKEYKPEVTSWREAWERCQEMDKHFYNLNPIHGRNPLNPRRCQMEDRKRNLTDSLRAHEKREMMEWYRSKMLQLL